MIESVAGMISAAPSPITARGADELVDAAGEGGGGRRDAEDHEADGERTLAAEPVAQRTEGEEEAGEHQRVRVDHPLQSGDARAQVALEGGERDVDDGVVDHDDEQAHAEHREGEPAPLVPDLGAPAPRARRGADAGSGALWERLAWRGV